MNLKSEIKRCRFIDVTNEPFKYVDIQRQGKRFKKKVTFIRKKSINKTLLTTTS